MIVLFPAAESCGQYQYSCYNIPQSAIDVLRDSGIFDRDPGYPSGARKKLAAAKNWMVQLQHVNQEEIRALDPDLLVVDYADDGGEAAEWKGEKLRSLMEREGGGERLVIAYLSIGEAENYRFYWRDWFEPGNPEWLDKENPDWAGNFKVKFWRSGWREIIFGSKGSYLDRIIENGFDGVYLDMVDAYDYWIIKGDKNAREEMKEFVKEISAYAKEKKSGFIVIPQNALMLLLEPDYVAAADGVGAEDVYYYKGKPRTDCYPYEGVNYLRVAKKAGLAVLLIEYLESDCAVSEFFSAASNEGFIPYSATKNLDSPGTIYR